MLKTHRNQLISSIFIILFLVGVGIGPLLYNVYNTPLTTTQPSATVQSTATPAATHIPMLIHEPYKVTHAWVFNDTFFLGGYVGANNVTETYTIKKRSYEMAWSCIFTDDDGIVSVSNSDPNLPFDKTLILFADCTSDNTSGYIIVNAAPGTTSVTIFCQVACTIEIGERT